MNEDLAAWVAANAVRVDHLGPCATCGEIVRAGDECPECLEESGEARHDTNGCPCPMVDQ